MQKKEYIILAIIILVLGGIFFVSARSAQEPVFATAIIGGETFALEVADTARSRAQGLSDRSELADHGGMLFVFDTIEKHGFWMKDTLIPLDMIWLDENNRVVGIKEGATPESYPEVFYPDSPAQFVIELYGGTASRLRVSDGDTITVTRTTQ